MRYLRFQKDGEPKYGILQDDNAIVELRGDFLSEETKNAHRLSEVKLLAPCQPTKIVAVGLNYSDHAKELNLAVSPEPILFLKPSTSIIGPEEKICYPAVCQQLDYEGELALVIKKQCRFIKPEQAQEYILGYTCFNDVTARDLQKKDGQWTRAKSFDTFGPIGPWIVNGIEPDNLHLELKLNGEIKQASTTKNLIFAVPTLVSFISQVMTLLPGDVITTGTPPGVGPMKVNDMVEVSIEHIGILKNTVATP